MRKKAIIIALATMLVFSTGVAAAVTFTQLQPEKLSLFGQSIEDSDVEVTDAAISFPTEDEMAYDLTLTNNAGGNEDVEVTAKIMDSAGTVIDTQTVSEHSIAGGDTVTVSMTFTGTDLLTNVEETEIKVDQL